MKGNMPSIQMKFLLTGEERQAKQYEWFLNSDGMPEFKQYDYLNGNKVKILKVVSQKWKGLPIPQPRAVKVEHDPQYFQTPVQFYVCTGEMRLPKTGEWFITGDHCPPQKATFDYKSNRHRIVRPLNKTESPLMSFTRNPIKQEQKVA